MYEYPALVLQVVDGDTLDADIDLGCSVHVRERLRLAGLNCPEKNTAAGVAAKTFTADWLASRLGKVVVKTAKDKREKFGRYLATVYDEHELSGECLNLALLAAGHAVPYDGGKRAMQPLATEAAPA